VAGSVRRHGGATTYLGGGSEGDGGLRTVDERRLRTGRSEQRRGDRGISGAVGTAARRASNEAAIGLSGQRERRSGRGHGAVPTAPLWRGALVGAGAWQPHGDGALMSGPGAERKRLPGGTRSSDFLN
jgi:hypothetical protein